jgi:hypothetical protein
VTDVGLVVRYRKAVSYGMHALMAALETASAGCTVTLGTENLIVVSTRTYACMGDEQVALRAFTQPESNGTYHYHQGQVLGIDAVLSAGIVRRPGRRP